MAGLEALLEAILEAILETLDSILEAILDPILEMENVENINLTVYFSTMQIYHISGEIVENLNSCRSF